MQKPLAAVTRTTRPKLSELQPTLRRWEILKTVMVLSDRSYTAKDAEGAKHRIRTVLSAHVQGDMATALESPAGVRQLRRGQ